MRMIEPDEKREIHALQLYLTPDEAAQLKRQLFMFVGEKKPISTPCDITAYRADTGNIDGDRCPAKTRHIADGDFAAFMELRVDRTDRSVDAQRTRLQFSPMSE